jgi:ABC-2 type transport system permease protein
VRAVREILVKDLRVLRRSPFLVAMLVAYPLLVALLVGLVAGYANAKPRVALIDRDGLPPVVEIAGQRFDVEATIDRVADEVELVRLSRDDAERQLETGRIVASLTIPPGFVADLEATGSPTLLFETTQGGVSARVEQQVQALVYNLNRQLQGAYIEANLEYVNLILRGGRGEFAGQEFEILGLERTGELLEELPRGPRLDPIREFVRTAQVALAQTDDALEATASPIRLEKAPERGRTWALSAQVQAYGLAVTLTFIALLLTAVALAAERDEGVIGRLTRGLVSLGQLVWAKVALAAIIAVCLGLAIALVFGIAVEIGDVAGGEPWTRLPLLALGLALAGASLGALGAFLGALTREARTASLVAVLVVLPIVFLGIVPREIVPTAGAISDALPFAHAVRLFTATLYDTNPWRDVGVEAAWLAGLGLVFGVLARMSGRRLLA